MTAAHLRYLFSIRLFALLLTGLSPELLAKSPLAPSNGTATYTWVGIPGNNAEIPPKFAAEDKDPLNWRNWRTWRLTWQDNATDEEGYSVSIRYGTGGPFYPFANLPADSTSAQVSVGDIKVGTPAQFKVEAWKRNGAALESGVFIIQTTVPAKPADADFTAPSGNGAGATANATVSAGLVTAVTVANQGNDYEIAPSVVFSGGGGTGAQATATITDGKVTAINVTAPGTGYTTSPNVEIITSPHLLPTMLDKDPSPVVDLHDGIIRLSWRDNSTGELGYQIRQREAKDGATNNDWISIGTFPFNSTPAGTSALISNLFAGTDNSGNQARLQFVPSKAYEFEVRAVRGNQISNSSTGTITMPELNAPSNLNASALNENTLFLTWADNSTNETGYEIEYRLIEAGSNPPFQLFGTVGENGSNVNVPITQNATIECRVRAIYTYTPSGTTTPITLYSPYTANTAQASTTTFAAPSDLTATPSGIANTIDLTWKDNSIVESGFDILARVAGSGNEFKFARAVHANVNSVSVDSIAGTVDSGGRPTVANFVKLIPGTSYEFIVRAVGDVESVVSVSSNTATATPRAGFTMPRLYHPAQIGQVFNYTVTTSTSVERTGLTASGLPDGLTFNSSSGLISGIPTTTGVFLCPLSATFSNGVIANATLTLRVLGIPGQPAAGIPIPNITVGLNSPTFINLADKFTDSDAETAVRMETTRGNIDLMLFPSLAPQAVANFLSYVNAGDYDGVVFHRSVEGFVIQAGSLRAASAPRTFTSVSKRASPMNEPGVSNLRGTISAAKVGGRTSLIVPNNPLTARDDTLGYIGLPNSATTDFFLNLSNNAANLDNQNGGFTAFGRMTESSLTIMDQIAMLPKGSYQNNNTTNTYNASLDKRLIMDGSLVPFTNFPMNAGTFPADMDINKTVRINKASVIPVFTYTLDDVSADKAGVVLENGQLKVTGLAAGTRAVNVTARDFDGNTVSQSFTITVTPGFQPPAITKHPVSVVTNAGKAVTFSVKATGTGITYQWRRGGSNMTDKTSPTLTITNPQAGDAGVYDVVVSSGGRSVTSSGTTLTIRVPADITSTLPNELLIEAGQPLDLAVDVSGTPEPTFAWRRGTTVVKGQITKRLYIASTALTDAGMYKGTASNGGTDTTNACNVLVVDKATRTVVVAPGKPIKFTAPAAGPFVSYRWRKGGVNIPLSQEGFSGMTSATLSIKAAQFGTDSGDYTCQLIPPGSLPVTVSGIVHLSVSNAPQLQALAAPTGFVGNGYSYAVPYLLTDANTPTAFIIKGLPPGLTFDRLTGVISGRPTSPGIYQISAQASNPTGTGPAVTGTLRIVPPTSASVGTYVAIVNPRQSINYDKGGRLDLTVTDTAAFTAKLQLGPDVHSLKGTIAAVSVSSTSGALVYQGSVDFKNKAGRPFRLIFQIDPDNGDLLGVVMNEAESVNVFGHRQSWEATRNPCIFRGAPINLAITLPTDLVGRQDLPQGEGYMSLNVTAAGIGTAAGRLPDGTTITSSAILGSSAQFVVFQMLYKNTGSYLIGLGLRTARDSNASNTVTRFNSLNGISRWVKDFQSTATERNYKSGFPAISHSVRGWFYEEPGDNPIVMNLPASPGNAQLDFNQGGLISSPDTTFQLNNANQAVFTANPAKVTLKVTPTTGAYTGTFELDDGGIKRKVTFQGLIIPAIGEVPGLESVLFNNNTSFAAQSGVAPTNTFGAGYFLLDQLPVAPSTKSASLLSGSARLGAPGINISDQPDSQTVNPGANVNFTFTASGGLDGPSPVFTYQWRKNGINISGATTTTLALTNVQQANEGSYDCVIRKSVTLPDTSPVEFTDINITTTQAAILTVNDPVSDIIITQVPARSTVPTGTSVTFTAEPQGTGTFEYQWRFNGTDIPGATSNTYQIASVNTEQAGSYTVLVKNGVSTSGVLSAAKSLAHATPITAVTASRSPTSNSVAAGGAVTFSASSNGSAPFAYQWLKNDIAIPAANSSSLTIHSTAPSDNGVYKVLVSNSVSIDGINSNQVPLDVTQSLSNITITPSFAGSAAPTNTTITLTAGVTGTGPVYQWRKNETPIPGEVTSVLSIPTGSSVNLDMPDRYDVLISNAAVPEGVLSQSFALTVAEPVTNVLASRSPSSTAIPPNSPVTFSVSASGTALTYQWRKAGIDITGESQSSYTIASATEFDASEYTVLVSNVVNPAGILSSPVNLSLMEVVSSVSIALISPSSPMVAPGTPLSFSASAIGGSGHTFQWLKNDVAIPGATGSTYETTASNTAGDTTYTVRAFNDSTPDGLLSESITITVTESPEP